MEIAVPISGRKLLKLFEEIGYVLVPGGKGSHMKLKKDSCPTVIIPDHKELKKGTEQALRKILENVKLGEQK
jgi:predicted RNA binding protein YcfA (HicA-like mRNA interferase family)